MLPTPPQEATLYPAQSRVVGRVIALPKPRRAILPWDTGCGKTVAACDLIKRTGAPSVLIICPAIVRDHWRRHIEQWVGDRTIGVITESHAAACARSKAAGIRSFTLRFADVVICSYDLVHDLSKRTDAKYGLIAIDELHHIGNPKSRQSKEVRKLMLANPQADVIGLSATLAPTDIQQLWNPLRLFDGEAKWGAPSKTGGISWRFLGRYCEKEKTEWGTNYFGLKPSAEQTLRANMNNVVFPLTRAEVLPDMPPLDLHVVTGDVSELVTAALPTANRILVMRHKRQAVHDLYEHLSPTTDRAKMQITGSMPIKQRVAVLELNSREEKSLTVATYDSMAEGIRLLWPDQVYIADWQGSPGKLMQLLGRFVSVGSGKRPQVNLIANDDTYSAAQAIARRAPGIIAAGLSSHGLSDVAAKIEENTSATNIDWDSMLADAIPEGWSDADDE